MQRTLPTSIFAAQKLVSHCVLLSLTEKMQSRYCHTRKRPRINKELRTNFTIASADELKSKVECDEVFLIDVREPHEVEEGHVDAKRFLNLPIGQVVSSLRISDDEFKLKYGVKRPAKDADDLVIMCLVGIRSTWALQAFHTFGYKFARHYPGGWTEWNKRFSAKNRSI